MSLLPNAQAVLVSGVLGAEDTEILDFLINNAVGKANAKPWKAIDAHIKALSPSIVMAMQDFQHGLLAHSRANNYFIGSSNTGFFIIDSLDDAQASASYYRSRIASESIHLTQLEAIGLAHIPTWIV